MLLLLGKEFWHCWFCIPSPHSHFQGLDSIPEESSRPILLGDISRRLLHPPGADLECFGPVIKCSWWDQSLSVGFVLALAGSGLRVREGSRALLEGNDEHKAITAPQGNLLKLSACPSESQIN